MAGTETLLEAVRSKLNITWSDTDTEKRINEILENGKVTLRHKCGIPDTYDFEEPGQERNTLLSWCLYEWNHASNEFDQNYSNDVLQLRQKWEVKGYDGEAEQV